MIPYGFWGDLLLTLIAVSLGLVLFLAFYGLLSLVLG